MSPPSPPPTPNPYAVAQAQTSTNVDTAIAQTFLQNADEYTPQGTVNYVVFDSYSWTEPTLSSDGSTVTGSVTRNVPRFKKTTTLTTSSQNIFSTSQSAQLEMAQWALMQTQAMQTIQSVPFSLDGLPAAPTGSNLPIQNVQNTLPAPAIIKSGLSYTSSEDVRNQAMTALDARTQFLIDRDRTALIVKLANQGIRAGTRAYLNEMRVFDQQSNDARNRDYIAAGQDAMRMFQLDFQSGQFANMAQDQGFRQGVITAQFFNAAQMEQFSMLHQLADFLAIFRERSLQERIILRNQPIQEITALLHGSQVTMPQFTQYKSGKIENTPVGQYVYQSAALDMQKWQMQVQQQSSMFGGMLGMFGNLFSAGMGMM